MVDIEEKYYPHNIAWIILNRLKEFNDKPEFIRELNYRFNRLSTHTLYFKFAPFYEEAMKYFEKHNKFPGIKYFNERFTDGRVMLEMTNASFSMDMYDELKKQLDYELLIQDFNERIGHSDHIDIEGCREFGKRLTKFAETNVDIPIDVKEDWLNSYEKFEEEYHGISTGNKIIDEQVGKLSGVVTVAAPSGNGKSTFALSMAYNISTLPDENGQGRNVLYISYEMTKFELQACLASIESSFSENFKERLKATDIREKNLDDVQKALYKKHLNNYMQRLNFSKGYISLCDNTAMNGYSNIDEFFATIEEHSLKVGKKFDLIIIDNFDSLKMLKGEKGQDETAKMNYFVTKIDSFTKTYMDGYGTCVILLSQTNRDGLKKLKAMEANGSQEITIDFTVLQMYSALYERATAVLVLYSSALMRSNNQLKLMPVKLRNKPLPRQPITLTTRWDYSYVGGSYTPPTVTTTDLTGLVGMDYNEDDDSFDMSEGMVMGAEESEPIEAPPWEDGEDIDDITLD